MYLKGPFKKFDSIGSCRSNVKCRFSRLPYLLNRMFVIGVKVTKLLYMKPNKQILFNTRAEFCDLYFNLKSLHLVLY